MLEIIIFVQLFASVVSFGTADGHRCLKYALHMSSWGEEPPAILGLVSFPEHQLVRHPLSLSSKVPTAASADFPLHVRHMTLLTAVRIGRCEWAYTEPMVLQEADTA